MTTKKEPYIDTRPHKTTPDSGWAKHVHNLSRGRLLSYIDSYPGADGPGYWGTACQYRMYCVDAPIWTHEELRQLAAVHLKDNVATIEVEKIVEVKVEVPVEVVRIVKVPFAETLSFGEAASLQASLYHGQHLLNEDLRLAYTDNDPAAMELAQQRLTDHLSLMERLGVPPARWDDNERALKRSREVAERHINGTIWS